MPSEERLKLILDKFDIRALLLKVSNLLEELLETFDVLEDKETMEALREAEEDVKAGRVKDYDKLVEGLKRSGEI